MWLRRLAALSVRRDFTSSISAPSCRSSNSRSLAADEHVSTSSPEIEMRASDAAV